MTSQDRIVAADRCAAAVLDELDEERDVRRAAVAGLAALSVNLAGPCRGAEPYPWPDSYLGQVEAVAAMESLNSALLASHSATTTLESWCSDHHLATPARITARRIAGPDKPISAEQRLRLQVSPDEPIRYRHVRLACGDHVLSEADNWYVPSRLTPEMNRQLDNSDVPFGRVVLPLGPMRETLSTERLWSPLPAHWEMQAAPKGAAVSHGDLVIPPFIFRHRALVFDAQHHPFAEVAETYTGETLKFARTPPL